MATFLKASRNSPSPLVAVKTSNNIGNSNDSIPFSHSDNDTMNITHQSITPTIGGTGKNNGHQSRITTKCTCRAVVYHLILKIKSIHLLKSYLYSDHIIIMLGLYATYKTYEKLPYFPKKLYQKAIVHPLVIISYLQQEVLHNLNIYYFLIH